jgi:hypothetical protein
MVLLSVYTHELNHLEPSARHQLAIVIADGLGETVS